MKLSDWLITAGILRPAPLRRPRRTALRQARRVRLGVEHLEERTVMAGFFAVGTDAGPIAEVRIWADANDDGVVDTLADHQNIYGNFTGGLRVAMGDFNGDGNDELAVAAGPGGGPRVTILELHSDGTIGAAIDDFQAYGSFSGGVNIAAGDLDGDGFDELITAPDFGGAPIVQIFSDTDRDGELSDNLVDSFNAYGAGFFGGVRLAAGFINSTNGAELVTAPGPTGGPHVKVFTDSDGDGAVSDQAVLDSFFAYGNFTGGVYLAVGHVAGSGLRDEIITAPGAGGGPHIRVFIDNDGDGLVSDHPTFDEFFAYDIGFTGGVRLGIGNTDGNAVFDEILTAPGPGGGPHIKALSDSSDNGFLISDNPPRDQFLAFDAGFTGGTFVAYGEVTRSSFALTPVPHTIFDQSTLEVSIFVPHHVGRIEDINIGLFIDHTHAADLDVTLVHVPSGQVHTLFTDVGGSSDGLMILLDDSAITDISDATSVAGALGGRFNPEGSPTLNGSFRNRDASGEWLLRIIDDAGGDTGSLLGWTLHFEH